MAARTRPPAEALLLAPQHHPRLGSQLQQLAQHRGFYLASQLQRICRSATPLRQGMRHGVPTSYCSLCRRRWRGCRSRQERHLKVSADTLHPHFYTRIYQVRPATSTRCP